MAHTQERFGITTVLLGMLLAFGHTAQAQDTGRVAGRVLDQTWADWNSTDQVAERAIATGRISRFGSLDATDGGKTSRQSIAADFQRSVGSASIRATGFLLQSSLNLFSNFTYFLDDAENGDQSIRPSV